MTIKVGDTVLYRTPMLRTVQAKVVGITANDENPEEPFLDLTFTDPTFNQELTVHEIGSGTGMFEGSPHTWSPAEPF